MIPITKSLLVASVVVMLGGCSPEKSALNEFKKSEPKLASCVGPRGTADWKIYKSENFPEPELRIIDLTMNKDGQFIRIQWLYNVKSKLSELRYLESEKGAMSRFDLLMKMSTFCS